MCLASPIIRFLVLRTAGNRDRARNAGEDQEWAVMAGKAAHLAATQAEGYAWTCKTGGQAALDYFRFTADEERARQGSGGQRRSREAKQLQQKKYSTQCTPNETQAQGYPHPKVPNPLG